MKPNPVVMISSTAHDLPDYRAQAMDACYRMDMQPKMMEHLPALNADAIDASLNRLVDEADMYVGIFAHRYGYIPEGHGISITQMEYDRAVELDLPRLIFMMHDSVPVLPKDFDTGEPASKLEALKARLKKERVIQFFKNPEDLRGLLIHALSEIKKEFDSTRTDESGRPTGAALAESLHYISEIPQPPEPYIAHPYTLLQVRRLVGRKEELELLTDWVTGRPDLEDIRIFNVVAIGGMGKSALTWTWFNEVAPQEMTPLAGRIWWSFYESDATFDNFVTRALAYVSRRLVDDLKGLSLPEREDWLLRILDQEPFLIALDGLERILTAYARLDAAYLRDEDALDEETANHVAGAYGLPRSAGQSFVGKHKLRMTADPRAGRFLRELARVHASRILVSTRLYPADLQAPGGAPSPACFALFLPGLSDQDALELWRAYGAKGSRDVMLPVFRAFDKHPLLLQLLAYEVADFREVPGDFDAWKSANPDFDPFGMELANVQSHVLTHSMRGLSVAELRTLQVIAGFRMPASLETLVALLIRVTGDDKVTQKPFVTFRELDAALTNLEDRGLLGWDRRANRYDLHPIVRGCVWAGLDDERRMAVYQTLRSHFRAMPMLEDYTDVESIEDITPAIELYNTLVGLKLYNEAYGVFETWLDRPTHYRLSASQIRVDLLKVLFPDGVNSLPRLSRPRDQSFALTALAIGYDLSGKPGLAVPLHELAGEIDLHEEDSRNHATSLENLAHSLRFSGMLRNAEYSALKALQLRHETDVKLREAATLHAIAYSLAVRGEWQHATTAGQRSLRIWSGVGNAQQQGVILTALAEFDLWKGDFKTAKARADKASRLAQVRRLEGDIIRAARLQGASALELGDYASSSNSLQLALQRARTVSYVEEEIPILIALSRLYHLQDDAAQAVLLLEDLWDLAERGPYPMFHADALNVLAQIERDAGNRDAAVEAATKAYQLAWCDGPPFAYHRGLEKAKAHLAALGAQEPEMPPFDESKYEPMPEVEINPPDDFGGEDEDDEQAQ